MSAISIKEQVDAIVATTKAVMKEEIGPACRDDAQRIAAETMHEAARYAVEQKVAELAKLSHSFRIGGIRFTIRRELPKRRKRAAT